MPQLTIELEPEELRLLHALARRKRRSDAQQAAYSLVKYLSKPEESAWTSEPPTTTTSPGATTLSPDPASGAAPPPPSGTTVTE